MADLHETHSLVDDLAARLRRGEPAALARAITLVESRRADHRAQARRLVQAVLPATGGAIRVGITGVPGAGKSTLIDALGHRLIGAGHRVAVLAVDPSSSRSGGSILGDKTRMATLAADPAAFIRPSPAGRTLGGIAAHTREAMLLCEAAGFDIVLVETVGVGQSETAVADLVDIFLVLMLAGTGDELQGIKKGVIEIADVIAVNKADGENRLRAEAAAADLRMALHLLGQSGERAVPVTTVSGATGDGLDGAWTLVTGRRDAWLADGNLEARRRRQQVKWLHVMLEERVLARLSEAPVRQRLAVLEARVAAGELAPLLAADEIAAMIGA